RPCRSSKSRHCLLPCRDQRACDDRGPRCDIRLPVTPPRARRTGIIVNLTRLSLYYLMAYLILIGMALLFFPTQALRLMGSNGHYGDLFPRLAGMLMSGLGFNIAGIIRARAQALYPATLAVRAYFLLCLMWLYLSDRDPFFLVLLGIVLLGVTLTLG